MKNKNNRTNSINFLQYELKEILSTFVNGGFSATGYILYPLVRGISHSLVKRLTALISFVKSKNSINGLDFSNSLKKFKSFSNITNAKNFAIILSALYEDFDKNKKNIYLKKVNVKSNIMDKDEYNNEYLKPVLELREFSKNKLNKYVADVHVHGSLATLDYVEGWSDFDTLVVIKKDTIADYTKILELRDLMYISRKYLYKIDPLQHHGHLTFTEYDLDYYCQTFFPLALFKYSKSLLNNKSFKFKVRDCANENIKKFKWFVDYFKETALSKNYNMDSYNLKFFLHAVTLFPAMYLQAKDLHMYKKFTFDMAKKDFKKGEWQVIDYVSSLRKNWKSPKKINLAMLYAEGNPLLAYHISSKYLDIKSDIIKLNGIDTKKLVDGIRILAGSAENKISELNRNKS